MKILKIALNNDLVAYNREKIDYISLELRNKEWCIVVAPFHTFSCKSKCGALKKYEEIITTFVEGIEI